MTQSTRSEPRDTHGRFSADGGATEGRIAHVAKRATTRAAAGIDGNPIGLLVGGLAVGAIAGALVPRTAKEKELLAPVGKTLGERARATFDAARTTAQTELDDLGLSRGAARAQVRELADGLIGVAQKVGAAAMKSATDKG